MTKIKYIFNFIMMFIAYNGFAQKEQKGKDKEYSHLFRMETKRLKSLQNRIKM